MSEILIEEITSSRYAPVTLNEYRYNGIEGLSFGKLVVAVCSRRAAAIERQSIFEMNRMMRTNAKLNAVAYCAEKIFNVSSLTGSTVDLNAIGYVPSRISTTTPTLRQFLKDEIGIDDSYLYVNTYSQRIALYDELKKILDNAATQSQQEAISVQSLVSRRDTTFNTCSATVKSLCQTSIMTANALR